MRSKLKILLVEDNESDIQLIHYELRKSTMEFTLKVVQTRAAFEHEVDHFHPDIILCDYSLPAFDGLTAFHTKQRLCADLPFIIVSGSIGEEKAVELIKTGVTDYALKDSLFTLVPKIERGLKEADEAKEMRKAHEQLKRQNAHLTEIAFLQSHQVRAPIARILGLFNLFNFKDLTDKINVEVLINLKTVVESFDTLIHEIVDKTNQINKDGLSTQDPREDQTRQIVQHKDGGLRSVGIW